MTEQVRILILTADMGFGHRAAAIALAETLTTEINHPCLVEIFNPFNHSRIPGFLRNSQTNYDKIVRENPELQRISYRVGDITPSASLVEIVSEILFTPVLIEKIKSFQPDVIVNTYHVFIHPSLSSVHALGHDIPVVTIVTDLAKLHQNWFHKFVSFSFLPTEEAFQEASKLKIPHDRLAVTGVPLRKGFFFEELSAEEIRENMGWRRDLTTVLVAGSKRIKNLEQTLELLNHSGWSLQWILIAGGDEKLLSWFQNQEWHNPVYIDLYAADMAQYMHAADFIITKAGGLVVSESLASGLPMLIVDITPGQEEGNAEYIINHHAGSLAKNPGEALETITHWLIDEKKILSQLKQNTRKLGKPDAAKSVSKLLIQIAMQANENKHHNFSRT